MIFLLDNTKKEIELFYCIEEWHTSTPYDIFHNQFNYPTVCLLPDICHRNDHCITVCGKWIFDYNFEVAFPLTQDFLNYTWCGNDTDEIRFVGFLHAIRAVPLRVFQRRINMK